MKLKVRMPAFLFLTTLREYSVAKASSHFQVGLAAKKGPQVQCAAGEAVTRDGK